jgi:hypothetical protein
MKRSRLNKWINIAPALIASLIDIIITIVHQPEAYWNGNLSKGQEGNPIGAFFMANHVSGIFLISGIWLILIMILGYYLPQKISKYFLLFTLIAHSFGGSSWLSAKNGFWLAMVLILFNTVTYLLADSYIKRTDFKYS